jgi:hypothetical protein
MGSAAGSADKYPGARTQDRVGDVVRDVVADAAPAELPLVEGLSRFDDETVVRRLTRRSRPREPLGFGLDEVAVLVTPVVWIVVEEAARRVVDSAVTGAAKGLRALLRRLLGRRATPLTVPQLTREQIVEVQQRVLELAGQNGLKQERAAMLANLLGARLSPQVSESEESAPTSRSGNIGANANTETHRGADDTSTKG